jgi:Mg2+/Co2+ transporter CorB
VHSPAVSQSTLLFYSILIILLIVLSAFFSCSETALMALNRYRLRHEAGRKKRTARLLLKLLKRPDRLLAMMLVGNSVTNIFAAALVTLMTVHLFGDKGAVIFSVGLTAIILIFAEVAPKTLAALYPDRISRIVAWPVSLLLKLFYPLIWIVNAVSNGLLGLLRVKVSGHVVEPLGREELRSIVYEGTGKVLPYQRMLLGILDLNKMTVDDVMVPRHKIIGVDLEQSWPEIQQKIVTSQHDWLPFYRENINQVMGVLQVRQVLHLALSQTLKEETLLKLLQEPYFIPKGALLNIQLQHFQRNEQRMALVVDEYGEVQGLLTLKDILEEIVGEFTSSISSTASMIVAQADGSYLADGSVTIREFNCATKWKLPVSGPKTLNGLIVEYLEAIPRAGICVRIAGYPMEILEAKENRIKTAHLFPRLEITHAK